MPITLLRLAWVALLLLPNVSTLAVANAWEASPLVLAVASCITVLAMYALLPSAFFLVLTLPFVLCGFMVVAGDWTASVNLLELLSVAYIYKPDEITGAFRPYLLPMLLAALVLLSIFGVLLRFDRRAMWPRRARLTLAGALAAAAVALPASAWLDAWPMQLLPAVVASQSLDVRLALTPLANMRTSPRDRYRSWEALRTTAPSERETYVLMIGETIRSDRVPGCGGRTEITHVPGDALLYCDMLAGASSTHVSLPLLVSRELPGHMERVSSDATFLRAFEEVGFETYWLSLHHKSIAWPDARNQVYDLGAGLDRDRLIPLFETALARPAPRKVIVLHAYNAHSPYISRYRRAGAPFPVDEARVETDDGERLNAYDNAVDESMQFLDMVIARLRKEPGHAFILFTPDHGENLHDDRRHLLDHALKYPTLWDSRVPAVIWGNGAWRESNAPTWAMLESNRGAPLMHMDVVPTLLRAAHIGYREPRSEPIDIGGKPVTARQRFTQLRPGETVDFETLQREAHAK